LPGNGVAKRNFATRSGCARRGRSRAEVNEDVAFRLITANRAPDHATITRFRVAPRGGDP